MPSTEAFQPSSLQERLRFEELLAELSSTFINLRPAEVGPAIEDALRRVCEVVGIDYAVLWQWSVEDPGVVTPTHQYPVHEGQQPPDPLRQDQYPWVVGEMQAGRMVALSSLDETPAEGAVDRESARLSGIKSNLCLPLTVGGEAPVGALAFNTLQVERDWPEALTKRLQLVAQVFTNALARGRQEASLQESKARLRAGADLAGLAFYEVVLDQGIMYVDDRMRELCGIPPDRAKGLEAIEFWMEHLHPEDIQRVAGIRDELHHGKTDRVSLEYRYLHPSSGEMWIQHLAGASQRDESGRATRTYGVLREVSERKRVEGEMRDLNRRLVGAHEEQRAMLARELHDDLTQRVAVLAIETGRAENAAANGSHAESLRSVREGLVRLSEDIHSLAYQLHPSVLDELGLAEALQAECEHQGRRGRFEISLNLDASPAEIGKEAALCLFRVAQEALNNVWRHAGAGAATLSLRRLDDGLLLGIRDDGAGFDPAHPGSGRNLGLASMRERVRLVGGTLDIESTPGRGTAIVAWVPVRGSST